ncbi:MAG: hypothetical protein GX946_07300 [Oligosphaeraceae bacterium]|nr:hypothetical protein [Oligosphaeraceae bacterium]
MPENCLPSSCIPVPKIENDCYDWYARHEHLKKRSLEEDFDIIFIGDSITHFWEGEPNADHGSEVWKEYYGRRKVLNIGYGFDRTQNVLWRLEHDEIAGQNPKLIVVNIGTNQFSITNAHPCDTAEDAAAGIIAVAKKLRKMFPYTRLLFMGIFPRGERDSFYRTIIPVTNTLVGEALSSMKNVCFMDLRDQFEDKEGNLISGLYRTCMCHLFPKGYRVWANAIEPEIRNALNTTEK